MRTFNPFAVWSQVPLANRKVRTGDYAEYACTLTNSIGPGTSTTATSDVNVITFTVPANTWNDGESIIIRATALSKMNTADGNTRSINYKISCTGASSSTVTTTAMSGNASEFKKYGVIELMRVGSKIEAVTAAFDLTSSNLFESPYNNNRTSLVQITPTAFTSDITVNIVSNFICDTSATIATDTYFKPQWAYAYKSTTFRR